MVLTLEENNRKNELFNTYRLNSYLSIDEIYELQDLVRRDEQFFSNEGTKLLLLFSLEVMSNYLSSDQEPSENIQDLPGSQNVMLGGLSYPYLYVRSWRDHYQHQKVICSKCKEVITNNEPCIFESTMNQKGKLLECLITKATHTSDFGCKEPVKKQKPKTIWKRMFSFKL